MRDGGPQLAAETRAVFGKKVRFLRRQGVTPGNIFGHAVDSTAIQMNTREMEHVLSHVPRSSLLSLNVQGGKPTTVMVKAVTRKPTTGELYHVDFYQVSMTEKLRADIPIALIGTAPAADTYDATILQAIDSLHVECLPGDLPPQIQVDVTRLARIDDAIFVRDLELPHGVTALVSEDDLVVKALAPTIAEEIAEEEAEAAAEAAAEAEAAGEAPAAEAEEAEATEGEAGEAAPAAEGGEESPRS
jgi:large subunit ribosomal protein L25